MDGNIKVLEDWLSLPEAADELGISRQGLHFRVNQGLVPGDDVRIVVIGSKTLVLIHRRYFEKKEAMA